VAGYVALMINGKTPDSWAAAVEDFGVFDWFATMSTQSQRSRNIATKGEIDRRVTFGDHTESPLK
jgi:dipeptidyl aminopeptidase/acylaminoacyl peptidase